MSRRWVYWGLGLMPLIWWPWASVPYEVPKVTVFLLWSAGLFLLGTKHWTPDPSNTAGRQVRGDTKTYWTLLGLYFLVLLVASYWGADWPKSLAGNYYRRDGLFTIATLVLVSVTVGWIKIDRQKILQVLMGSGMVLSVLAIFRGVGGWSVFGNPNFLAGYLVTIFPSYFAVTHARAPLAWLIILLHHVALLMTQSWVGVILVVGYWIWRMRKGKLVYPLIITLVGCLVVAVSIFGKQAADSLVASNHYHADSRARVYLKMVLGGVRRPWLGYGVANADYAFEAIDWPMKFGSDIYVDKAHGSLLEVFVTSGLVGLAAYLALIGYVFCRALRSRGEVGAILLLSFLFAQTNIISVSQEVVFWVLAGLTIPVKYGHV